MAGDELLHIPDIPVEIVRIILETLAIMSRPDALRLVLVCKVIRKWIDVILYHSVTIVSYSQYSAFLGAIQSRAEAGDTSFFADTVKYLHLDDALPGQQRDRHLAIKQRNASARALVSACSGLVALGLRDGGVVNAAFMEVVLGASPSLCVKRLSLSHWSPNNTLKHLPPTLTHLRYTLGSLPLDLLRTVPLTYLIVSLNSILFDDQMFVVNMKRVVEAMPDTVELCVFAYDGKYSLPEDPKDTIRDPRVALLGIMEEDRERHGLSWKVLTQDCGFLPDGHLDTWEFYAKLVKEGRSECTY